MAAAAAEQSRPDEEASSEVREDGELEVVEVPRGEYTHEDICEQLQVRQPTLPLSRNRTPRPN